MLNSDMTTAAAPARIGRGEIRASYRGGLGDSNNRPRSRKMSVVTQLAGVPAICPHCHTPTHNIALCGSCGMLTTTAPQRKADKAYRSGATRKASRPKDKERRRQRMAGDDDA